MKKPERKAVMKGAKATMRGMEKRIFGSGGCKPFKSVRYEVAARKAMDKSQRARWKEVIRSHAKGPDNPHGLTKGDVRILTALRDLSPYYLPHAEATITGAALGSNFIERTTITIRLT